MSSGLNPQVGHIGLILPLCSSSATIGLALYQYPQFTAFLQAQPSISGKTLSRYWEPMVKQGYIVIGALGLTSCVSGLLSARWLKQHRTLETTDVSNWYMYGAILAATHFAFLPLIGGPIRRMIETGSNASTLSDDEAERVNRQEMSSWFMWHTIRTIFVDVPALWCFAEGAAQSFWVVNV
ncbi:hypothetical protein LTR37_017408 [Vermiconidia calcicola]|uniref:Uncharacterized protein n=1 Tax=Vermiconidia calcicola TaxID=1690605 RepID=A0ACC3MK75_9PEZI|nr:hypothetical protein LTR37_017408 [Vermiconidia calcicola]